MIRFSIILPVRNGGEYVKECVYSILSQTYIHFKLHILDNNSTDGTLEWLKSLNDDRIEITPSPISLSIEENWARVLSVKKNEYMTLIGHDDILLPNYFEIMHQQITNNPEASLYLTHFDYINHKGATLKSCLTMLPYYSPDKFLESILKQEIDINGTGFIMKSYEYDLIGGIPMYPSLLFADFELWIKLVNLSGLVVSPVKGFYFRIHQSTTSVSKDYVMLEAFSRFISFLLFLSRSDKAFDKVIKQNSRNLLKRYCKGLCHRLLRTSFEKRNRLSVKFICTKFSCFANELEIKFKPTSEFTILISLFIDSNRITRKLFLIFKVVFSKPILN